MTGSGTPSLARRSRLRGLTIEGGLAPFHLPQALATDDASSIGVADFVLIAVKLWDTAAAIEQVKPIVGPHTTVISLQNGVSKDRYLVEAFGESRVMGGVAYVATTIGRPGVICQTGPMQRLLFGELDGATSDGTGHHPADSRLRGSEAGQALTHARSRLKHERPIPLVPRSWRHEAPAADG